MMEGSCNAHEGLVVKIERNEKEIGKLWEKVDRKLDALNRRLWTLTIAVALLGSAAIGVRAVWPL